MILFNAKIVGSNYIIGKGWIKVIDDKIVDIGIGDFTDDDKNMIDCQYQTIIPSFIDIHTHGGYGIDFMELNDWENNLTKFSKSVLKEGVTDFCLTTVASEVTTLNELCSNFSKFRQNNNYAHVQGLYLEGPFINKKFKGAHNENYLIAPDINLIKQWNKLSGNAIKFITIALELNKNKNLISDLKKEGIVTSFGHSDASLLDIQCFLSQGLNHVTHLFNAMRSFSHRNCGVTLELMLHKKPTVELICDGVHVDFNVLKTTYQLKKADKIIAITDANRAKGCADGNYQLGSLAIQKRGNKAVLASDSNTIAGSVTTMLSNFVNLLWVTDYNWSDCVKMTSLNAAKKLAIDNITGDIKIGNLANMVILNPDLTINQVINRGVCHAIN